MDRIIKVEKVDFTGQVDETTEHKPSSTDTEDPYNTSNGDFDNLRKPVKSAYEENEQRKNANQNKQDKTNSK